MKQPHSEDAIEHTDGEQDTGNHKSPDAAEAGGADRFGGTRAGSQNVEPAPAEPEQGGSGSATEQLHQVEDVLGDAVGGKAGPHTERPPASDEFGTL